MQFVNNQYEQKSEVLYTFTPYKFCVYLLNVKPNNLKFSKIHDTEFDEIITTISGQTGRPLEVEEKINLTLFFNKYKSHVIL